MLPDLAEAAQLRASGRSSCWYTAHSILSMTLIRANILACGLIGKTDHIELFGNINLIYLEERSRYWDFGNTCFEFS
jgi:hypothetical protein